MPQRLAMGLDQPNDIHGWVLHVRQPSLLFLIICSSLPAYSSFHPPPHHAALHHDFSFSAFTSLVLDLAGAFVAKKEYDKVISFTPSIPSSDSRAGSR